MVDAQETILVALEQIGSHEEQGLDTLVLAGRTGVSKEDLERAMLSLAGRGAVLTTPVDHARYVLSNEASSILDLGVSPEMRVLEVVRAEAGGPPPTVLEMESRVGDPKCAKIGLQNAMKKQWVALDKETKRIHVKVSEIQDELILGLRAISEDPTGGSLEPAMLKELKSRKMVQPKPFKTYLLTRGPAFGDARKVQATELTKEMLESGEWEHASFKEYNFSADGKDQDAGFLHPLLKVREQIRNIFFSLGFEEMPTNNYVESSFWNFDALFQPQQHPARDAHDTFFLSDPPEAKLPDSDYVRRVKEVHEIGGYGSRGYRYDWDSSEAKSTILRTHTTAVSSRMLYSIAQEKVFRPRKLFSIDRVFRNETLDATHLAEFHQIEGLVADRNLSLGHLKGIIHLFFQKIGFEKLRFKPAHNPYTEPSMEIFGFHEGLNRWVEIGNSGIFRPEMLRPMGLPEDVSVIAWGLSLERPTMIKYKIDSIRELFGHRVDIAKVHTNPICRIGY
mmetsp:Transcript_10064/g.20357  ORF Transcript_10064/g.20357 Transcript_10064/m.20357 type:complete len:506 (-) Transcript_10064:1934-3451(-)